MTEFENIFEEANKKNAKEAPPPKAAPAATEKNPLTPSFSFSTRKPVDLSTPSGRHS